MQARRSKVPRGALRSRLRRRLVRATLAGAALAAMAGTRAQSSSAPKRIGFLASDSMSTKLHEGFRTGLREVGLVEPRQVTIEWRFAEGRYERLPALARELVKLDVDVLVASTALAVQATRQATPRIPIVMIAVPDPVGEGFASSLSRPNGNITGLSSNVTEASGKHVELMNAVVPKLARAAILINPQNPSDALILEQVQGAAYSRGIKVLPFEASRTGEIDAAFAAMARQRVEGVIVAADPFFDVQWDQVAALAARHRLPSIFSSHGAVDAGGLMSYGQDLAQHYRRAAGYVDRILHGAKPANLPIEQPTMLELVVNLRVARAIGVAVPSELRVRADRLVE